VLKVSLGYVALALMYLIALWICGFTGSVKGKPRVCGFNTCVLFALRVCGFMGGTC
jgi:hypothetical protein